MANRLKVYAAQTAPLLDWYTGRGVLVKINGVGDADAIASAVAETIRA